MLLIPVIKTKPHHWEAVGIVDTMNIHAILQELPTGKCRCTINLIHDGTGYERTTSHTSVDHALFYMNRLCRRLGFEFQVVKTATS